MGLATLVAALVCAPGATAATAPFSWSLVSRFGGDADGDGLLDPDRSGLPRRLDRHPVLLAPTPEVCRAARAGRAAWTVDGRPLAVELRDDAQGRGCSAIAALARGPHRVAVDIGAGARGATVTVRDHLVVALGDSVASGEGTPVDVPRDGTWLERRCHRSVAAGFEQAARLLAEGLRSTSITFVSLACSGATVYRGLLGPYAGIEPPRRGADLRPQVERLARLAGRAPPAAVLLSVGANDIGFSDVVRHCARRPSCPGARLGRGGRPADEAVALALASLPVRYAKLARRFGRIRGLRPGRVLVTEYFDPTHDASGRPCRRSLPGVSQAEAAWAHDSLLRPLNGEIARAAALHRWTLVDRIAGDFLTHGYCVGGSDGWIRTLLGSALTQAGSPPGARLAGTLHPNERGHLAIADRVAPALARTLGLGAPPERTQAREDGGIPAWLVVLGVSALLLAAAVLRRPVAGIARRTRLIFGSAGRDDPTGARPAPPRLPRIRMPATLPEAAAAAGATLLAAVVSVSFVAFVGAAVLWVRFWAARVPADQAVAAVDRAELVATGAQALLVFGLLAVVALALVWLVDSRGQPGRASRRGLGLLLALEVVCVILIEDFGARRQLQLIAGLVAGALLLHFVVDRAMFALPALRSGASLSAWPLTAARRLVAGDRPGSRAGLPRTLWRALPPALLVVAVVLAVTEVGVTRWLALVAIAAAAVAFVAPGGLAARAAKSSDPALEPVRIALATAALTCLVVLLIRDEWWLAAAVGVAVLLAGTVLVVAGASGESFAPYGLAVMASVPLFGAAATLLAAIDSPQLQPAAAISQDGQRLVCGAYVGESDGRLWIARIELDESGEVRRPRDRRASLTSIARDGLAGSLVGPLQPAAHAADRAVQLGDDLAAAHGTRVARRPGAGCRAHGPAAPAAPAGASPERRLAERHQPRLVLHRDDGFWPVEVSSIFAMQGRRARTCRRADIRERRQCLRLTTATELPWAGGEGEWIELPADHNSVDDQQRGMLQALGSSDPSRTARGYFLATGGEGGRPLSLQYWFFYTYNYQPLGSAGDRAFGGRHEGDFESVGLVLSARTHRPRYVWMARHAQREGRPFTWEEDALQRTDDHLVVHVARGSHASYESCTRKPRYLDPKGLIDDRPACAPADQLHLAPEVTPLSDLSRVWWGCWRGLFGHRREGGYDRLPHLVGDAPRSPLWQQDFGDQRARPCGGVEAPAPLAARGEEVLRPSTAARLRRGAGRLDALFDDCHDWDRPPNDGAYLVACDAEALRSYVASGLEDGGQARVRVDVATGSTLSTGELTLPAVRRTSETRKLDAWRLAAVAPATVRVYAACRQRKHMIEGRFPPVALVPGRAVHVDDRLPGRWRLRTEDGTQLAETQPVRAGGGPASGTVCG